MIASLLLGAYLAIIHPKPLMAEVAIDCSRIVGLPRLKTMDSYLYKVITVDEMHSAPAFSFQTRKEFFTSYFKIDKLSK